MYDLILSSNSYFSASFRKDVADILSSLRKNGQLDVTNDHITLKHPKSVSNMNKSLNDSLLPYGDIHLCSYHSPNDVSYVRRLISMGAITPIRKFVNKHVMYLFIIPLQTNHHFVLIKIGYTEDLVERFTQLKNEYKSNLFFVKANVVNGQKDELKFHQLLKSYYPSIVENFSIDSKHKTELYKLSPVIIDLFGSYMKDAIPDDDHEPVLNDADIQFICDINQQELSFVQYASSIQSDLFSNEQLRFDYLLAKENNSHQRYMADQEVNNLDQRLAFLREEAIIKKMDRDNEIELLKYRIQYTQLTSPK